jgi:hypothetical protein
MKKSSIFFFATILIVSGIVISCSSSRKNRAQSTTVEEKQGTISIPGPAVIVYKTKKDYNNRVPVTLSDDKSRIVSFPAPTDIKVHDKYTTPTLLRDGYLLDNRGIGRHTAFLRFTYDDYYTMDNIPTAGRLMNYIIDDDPFTEMYDCGKKSDFDNLIEMLNRKIEKGELSDYRNLLK